MSYSPSLGSSITNTHMRTPAHLSEFSGMCAVCTANCTGPCEIGLSAVRGSEAIYPFSTDINQFASEKRYPLDFSHININGRVFGAQGIQEDPEQATYPHVNIQSTFGRRGEIKLLAPLVLPAMAKLNWRDYFAGAALAGVLAVIGEDVVAKDKGLVLENGKVKKSPLIEEMVNAFRMYHRGYGEIILQGNYDDEVLGVLDYAITELGIKSVELKFGQAAKGIQGMSRVPSLEDALAYQQMGYLIHPNPSDPVVAENYQNGIGPVFERIGKLPMWDEAHLMNRVAHLRSLGAEQICFKMGPFDPKDLVRVLKIASKSGVDLVTFDGAGGGTGNSPTKMMNEWGIPTVQLESILVEILKELHGKGYDLPQVAIAGGFALEDQIFKGLALGAPYIGLVAVGRAAMGAAIVGKQVGEGILGGNIPKEFSRFGTTVQEIFGDIRELKGFYGSEAEKIPTGAIGVYSLINRISAGLKQLMALNRKFDVTLLGREDIFPLTALAAEVTGLKTLQEVCRQEIEALEL